MKRRNPYADRYCADKVISDGWRYVKEGGCVKIGGFWYESNNLKSIVGEYVHVQMGDYDQSYVLISRGAIGCMGWFCNAQCKKRVKNGKSGASNVNTKV